MALQRNPKRGKGNPPCPKTGAAFFFPGRWLVTKAKPLQVEVFVGFATCGCSPISRKILMIFLVKIFFAKR